MVEPFCSLRLDLCHFNQARGAKNIDKGMQSASGAEVRRHGAASDSNSKKQKRASARAEKAAERASERTSRDSRKVGAAISEDNNQAKKAISKVCVPTPAPHSLIVNN